MFDGLNIRAATPDDAIAVEAIHYASREAAYSEAIPGWDVAGPKREERIARWEEWLTSSDVTCLVAEIDGKMVGFACTRPSRDDDSDPNQVVEMPTLYVHPDHWRAGIGGALCAAAVERAKSSGFETLTLWVVDVNDGARAFYEALGFRPDGARMTDSTHTGEPVPAGRYRISVS